MSNRAENRHVWVFREMRTGGTGFSAALSGFLAKGFNFVPHSLDEAIISPDVVNNTHQFNLIEDVVKMCNPILIRVTRRNKVHQMLSKHAILHSANVMPGYSIINIQNHTTEQQLKGFEELVQNHPVTVQEEEVIGFAQLCLEYDSIWKSQASLAENTTVYYEDLVRSVSLPIVDLYDVSFLTGNTSTHKFPEYKNKLFTNYLQVEEWMKKYYYEYNAKKHYP